MGMQQKLEKEYLKGFNDGQAAANETLIKMARNDGIIQGAQETWDIIEAMIPKLEGIGPKTRDKIMQSIQDYAKKEKAKIIGWQNFENMQKGDK
jgi:hypothetical protein